MGLETYFESWGTPIQELVQKKESEIPESLIRPIVNWLVTLFKSVQVERLSGETTNILNGFLINLDSPTKTYAQKANWLKENYWDRCKGRFLDSFQKLSKEISLYILKDFSELGESYVIFADKIDSLTDKAFINPLKKEEGLFYESNGCNYLLRIESSNNMELILVTLKLVVDKKNTNYHKLENYIDNTATSMNTAFSINEWVKGVK